MALRKTLDLNMQPEIELMRTEDVDAVVELDKRCFPTPWSAGAYLTEVHNSSAYYVVARIDGRIVGYAGMWLIMDEAHVTTIGVDPAYRGYKIGERILVNLIDEAIKRHANRATLEVRKHNMVAQNLYLKYGFQVVAVRRGYYTNNNEDALVMWTNNMQEADYLKLLRMNTLRLESLG
jgi:ribosomal-protein-alanine N-acetyltransferase